MFVEIGAAKKFEELYEFPVIDGQTRYPKLVVSGYDDTTGNASIIPIPGYDIVDFLKTVEGIFSPYSNASEKIKAAYNSSTPLNTVSFCFNGVKMTVSKDEADYIKLHQKWKSLYTLGS